MGSFYKTREDAEFRLVGTIVGLDGSPVLVDRVREKTNGKTGITDLIVFYREFPFNGAARQTLLTNPGFNSFRPVKLGFCNYFDSGVLECCYCERTPVRRSKQGLCRENFRASNFSGIRFNFEQLMTSDGFNEMIRGEYPTYDEVIDRLVPGSAIAVSRCFALSKGGNGVVTLYYKNDQVGFVFRGQLYLNADDHYLLESILEEPNLPNNVEIM